MPGMVLARDTLEFKQAAARLVLGGQTVAPAAKSLSGLDQTLHHWLKAGTAAGLRERPGKAVSSGQMQIVRL